MALLNLASHRQSISWDVDLFCSSTELHRHDNVVENVEVKWSKKETIHGLGLMCYVGTIFRSAFLRVFLEPKDTENVKFLSRSLPSLVSLLQKLRVVYIQRPLLLPLDHAGSYVTHQANV